MTDELMALLAKATAGEWSHTMNPEASRWIIDSEPAHAIACGAGHEPATIANAAAIVAAVNFCRDELPALIAERERLRQALAWALAEIDGNTDYRSGRQQIAAYNRARAALGHQP
jgi:hypothetical protein